MAAEPTLDDYRALAAFRVELRRFFAFSAAAAAEAGIAPQQYQALLAIKGHPGEGAPSITDLAGQLLVLSGQSPVSIGWAGIALVVFALLFIIPVRGGSRSPRTA